jgi:ABC-type multidrug transport system permease subunit
MLQFIGSLLAAIVLVALWVIATALAVGVPTIIVVLVLKWMGVL